MPLDRDSLLDHLRRDAGAMVEQVRRVDLALPVPSCPGWTVADLVGHVASVHRWATDVVRTGQPAPEQDPPSDRAELLDWFVAGVPALLGTLVATVPGTECWTFGPRPRVVDFWLRRQALETAVHRWDLLDATGARSDVPADLAADGVDEVATVMYPRQVRLERIEPLAAAVALVCTDASQSSVIGGDGVAPAAATVSGPASDLLLLLWRRLPLESPKLSVAEDTAAAARLVATAVTP